MGRLCEDMARTYLGRYSGDCYPVHDYSVGLIRMLYCIKVCPEFIVTHHLCLPRIDHIYQLP
jgi:hypothetical protein